MTPTDPLEACLYAAIAENELINDILEACRITEVSVQDLGTWSPEKIEERLFLTPMEAVKLRQACLDAASGCSGTPVSQDTKPSIPQDATDGVQEADIVLMDEEVLLEQIAAAQTPEAIKPKLPDAATPLLIPEPSAESVCDMATPEVPAVPQEPICPAVEPVNEVVLAAGGVAPSHELPAPELVRSDSPTRPRNDNKSIPSYLRPTASHKARASKAEPETVKKSKAGGNSKPGFMSRLLAPTAAFLSRVTRVRAERKDVRQAQEKEEALRKSKVLSQVLSNPAGQRVTKAAPFALASDSRPKGPAPLTTEELAIQEAQKHAFKRHVVPAHVREARPLDGPARKQSTPSTPNNIFKPFHLASLDKHSKYVEMRTARLAQEKQAAEEARRFKAQALDKSVLLSSPSATRKAQSPVTVPKEFVLASASRAEHHTKVLEPLRREKMTEKEREALAERERKAAEEAAESAEAALRAAEEAAFEAELAALSVHEYRKRLVFKARDMPDFNCPFKPDMSKAAPATRVAEPSFATTKRLGEVVPIRERPDGCASLTSSACFHNGITSAFAGSLRSSTTVSTSRVHNPLRQSMSAAPSRLQNNPLRQSMSAVPTRPSSARATTNAARTSTSTLSTSLMRPHSAAATPKAWTRTRPANVPELKEALEVALEASASSLGLSRRGTADLVPDRITVPATHTLLTAA